MKIRKSSGRLEEFKKAKYLKSVKDAGVSKAIAEEILSEVEKSIKQNTTTDQISKKTAKVLSKHNMKAATNYNLRRGLSMLGPAGFMFEHYISELLRAEGFKNRRNVYIKGKCVSHEIDVVASDKSGVYFLEIKYHNKHFIKTHVDVAMYAYARLLDIVPDKDMREGKIDGKRRQMWVITNTKFTRNAIQYGECMDMKMLAWNYPKTFGLKDIITSYNLYPVTSIPQITQGMFERLAEKHILLTRDLCKLTVKEFMKITGASHSLSNKIINHAIVCSVDEERK